METGHFSNAARSFIQMRTKEQTADCQKVSEWSPSTSQSRTARPPVEWGEGTVPLRPAEKQQASAAPRGPRGAEGNPGSADDRRLVESVVSGGGPPSRRGRLLLACGGVVCVGLVAGLLIKSAFEGSGGQGPAPGRNSPPMSERQAAPPTRAAFVAGDAIEIPARPEHNQVRRDRARHSDREQAASKGDHRPESRSDNEAMNSSSASVKAPPREEVPEPPPEPAPEPSPEPAPEVLPEPAPEPTPELQPIEESAPPPSEAPQEVSPTSEFRGGLER